MTWGFPVTVRLVAVVCRNFGRAFCARSECRWRPGMFRARSAARAAASAVAARASSDDDAVTWEDVTERIAWRQTAVNDSSSMAAGERFRAVQRAGGGRLAVQRCGGGRADQLGGGQPCFGDDQPQGPGPQHGPEVRQPAPVIVALSSPKVVSDALHLVG